MTVNTALADCLTYAVRAKAESRFADEVAARQEYVDNYRTTPAATTTQGLSDIATQTTAIAVAQAASHRAGAF